MPILALETATEACSVAIYLDNGDIISRFQHLPRLQTQLLLPMVDELLAEAQLKPAALNAIAYSRGPGSFTGVRIAAATAQGLAFGWDLPVLAISSLQTLAQSAYRILACQQVISVFDARMNEVYLGAYALQNGLMQPVIEEVVCSPQNIPQIPTQSWALIGDGAKYATDIQAQVSTIGVTNSDFYPHAYDVAVLAQHAWQQGLAQAPELALPIYLRDNVWQKLPNKQ
ncbi:MAG: tRNA (adenosine(37)-N6)-threonylcarbamoyltransferase complex dimerization subunit type 1 TsaB [Moraxellaceae bacterium]|nr:tRNA (adenosine(37)-N6)-threonylcarbamoyltransferase complex dimerization subunit type 1 TsaB [Moraxellaceae bacterium]MCP5177517.1 tRNA (adenosine(37)-N6)-threonylcarbamoyltransferase complex dimerization subunit type 1 TsaB [Moraxellaceae bacterium]